MLLGQTEASYLIKAIQVAFAIGSMPYGWDNKKKRVIYVNTMKTRVIWVIHNAIYTGYMVFVFIRWVQTCIRLSPTAPLALGTLYIFVSYNFITSIQWSPLVNYGEHHMWLNNVIQYVEESQKEEKLQQKSKGKPPAKCIRTIQSLCIIVFLVLVLDTNSVFGGPDLPFFISSLLSNPRELTWFQLLPVASFHVYIWIHQWASYFFYGNILLCYVTIIRNALTSLRCPIEEKSWHSSISSPISPMKFSRAIRKLQIMQCFCNKMWSTTNVTYEICCIGGSILGFYGSVRLPGSRAAHQLVVAIFFASTLLNLWTDMGDIFESATSVQESWKRRRDNPWFRRFLKSVRVVRMNVGGFFYADKSIRLTIVAMIFQNTVNLLLSTSNK